MASKQAASADRRPAISRVIDGVTEALGTPLAVGAAVCLIVIWAVGGIIFGFTNTYQLIINTGTTIVTFVMVFAIQHTQNRETRAMNLKLDELLRAAGAGPEFIGAENEPEATLKRQQEAEHHAALRERQQHARSRSARGRAASSTRTETKPPG